MRNPHSISKSCNNILKKRAQEIIVFILVINVLLNLLLIPPFGFYGCAVACLITYFAKSIFALIISARRNKEIRFNTKSMYLGAFLAFVLSLLSLTLSDFSLGMNLLTKTLVCLLFVVFVFLLVVLGLNFFNIRIDICDIIIFYKIIKIIYFII